MLRFNPVSIYLSHLKSRLIVCDNKFGVRFISDSEEQICANQGNRVGGQSWDFGAGRLKVYHHLITYFSWGVQSTGLLANNPIHLK